MQAYFRQVPIIAARQAIMLPMGDQRIASIDALDIAEVSAGILTSAGHAGNTYPITGPQALTITEVAAALSTVTGKTIRYANATQQARQAWLADGVPPYNADALAELYAERCNGKEAHVSLVTPALLERPPTADGMPSTPSAGWSSDGLSAEQVAALVAISAELLARLGPPAAAAQAS
jgi:uncharacterized protein YbjT (DUF2867 family)